MTRQGKSCGKKETAWEKSGIPELKKKGGQDGRKEKGLSLRLV